jgi:hypothetical protein
MNTVISKISIVATPLMVVCALLASGGAAMAQSDDQHCSCTNRTLSGDYGYAAEGVLIPNPGLPPEIPFRSVGVAHFDGKGNFAGVEHTVVAGTSLDADWTANSGTYTINSDCTGKLVLKTPHSPSPAPLNLFFVAVKQGTEFHTVLDGGGALSSTWTKVGETRR